MGEIRFVGTGETRGYPYLVCKKRFVGTGETRGYPYLVCKKKVSHSLEAVKVGGSLYIGQSIRKADPILP